MQALRNVADLSDPLGAGWALFAALLANWLAQRGAVDRDTADIEGG